MKRLNILSLFVSAVLFVGCDVIKDPELTSLNLVSEDAKTSSIYKINEIQSPRTYIVRKDDNSIWLYKVCSGVNGTYEINGKAMIFNPSK